MVSAGTHHVAEGVAEEDGMTIEKGPVSTPLTGLTGSTKEGERSGHYYRITDHSIRELDEEELS